MVFRERTGYEGLTVTVMVFPVRVLTKIWNRLSDWGSGDV
jgi:hypothetical protein